jgi:hypothetical protein
MESLTAAGSKLWMAEVNDAAGENQLQERFLKPFDLHLQTSSL